MLIKFLLTYWPQIVLMVCKYLKMLYILELIYKVNVSIFHGEFIIYLTCIFLLNIMLSYPSYSSIVLLLKCSLERTDDLWLVNIDVLRQHFQSRPPQAVTAWVDAVASSVDSVIVCRQVLDGGADVLEIHLPAIVQVWNEHSRTGLLCQSQWVRLHAILRSTIITLIYVVYVLITINGDQ